MRWCSARSTARDGIARLTVALDRPVIGLGASAPLHYAGLPPLVGNRCIVPEDTDVANALGAVVGQVRVSAEALVSQPMEGLFRLAAGDDVRDFTDEAEALAAAEAQRSRDRRRAGAAAGTDTAEIEVSARSRPRPSRASACSSRRVSSRSRPAGRASRRERRAFSPFTGRRCPKGG